MGDFFIMIGILHNLRSVHNTASIFRTADGAGVERLYLCGTTPSPEDAFGRVRQDFAKVSLGAESSVSWESCARTADCIRRLKAEGYFICAAELVSGAVPYAEAAFLKERARKIAVVVGHETGGIPKGILARCDGIVYIPMRGRKESLNVAVAFGVLAFEIARNEVS